MFDKILGGKTKASESSIKELLEILKQKEEENIKLKRENEGLKLSVNEAGKKMPLEEDGQAHKRVISKEEEYKVLIVDDEEINIQVVYDYMTMKNILSDKALDGKTALELVAKNRYDLIILDIMMPGMSGYDVTREIRKKKSQIDLPILMLTAKTRPEEIIEGLEAGANDYVTKPFDKRELLARVTTLIQLKRSFEALIESTKKYEKEKTEKELSEEKRVLLEESLGRIKALESISGLVFSEDEAVKTVEYLLITLMKIKGFKYLKSAYLEFDLRSNYLVSATYLKSEDLEGFEFLDSSNYKNVAEAVEKKRVEAGIKKDSIKFNLEDKNIISKAFKNGENFFETLETKNTHTKKVLNEAGFKNMAFYPVVCKENLYGAIIVEKEDEGIKEEEAEFLKIFSNTLSLYLEKKRLEKEFLEKEESKSYLCTKCGKKLLMYKGKADFVEIKCPRCNTFNTIEK